MEKVAFRVFERQRAGEPLVRVRARDMIEACTAPRMRLVLFGEEHGHPLCHRLQLELYEAWLQKARDERVAISLEMLSTERQEAADEYVRTETSEEGLFAGQWANWQDYAPLVKAARRCKQPIVAANAPRRLTSIVAKGGEEALEAHLLEQAADGPLLAPMPLRQPSPEIVAKVGPIFDGGCGAGGGDRKTRMLLAQTLWDATMAHSIARELSRGSRVMHCCGRMHVEHYLGIGDHLPHFAKMFPDQAFSAEDRSRTRVVVCLSSDEALAVPDAQVAGDPHLAHIADFVVVCAEEPDAE